MNGRKTRGTNREQVARIVFLSILVALRWRPSTCVYAPNTVGLARLVNTRDEQARRAYMHLSM